MTCLRCGAPLPAGARFCAACGLPAPTPGAAPPQYGPPQYVRQSEQEQHQQHRPPAGPPMQYAQLPPMPYAQQPAPHPGWAPPPGGRSPYATKAGRAPLSEGVVRAARILQVIAALACLAHGFLALTVRRAAFVDLSEGRGGSASSDQLNAVLLTIATLTSLLAFVLAVLVLLRRRGRGAGSAAGISVAAIGWLMVLVGAVLLSGADTRGEADTAAVLSVLVGIGFLVVALGHALLAAGLGAPEREGSLATAPYTGPDPYAGTPLARDPADRRPATADTRRS